MAHTHDRTGGRFGAYHLDTCYPDLEAPGGQVYAAHNVDTGGPALVLLPDADDGWAPRRGWTARVTAQVSPPFLAAELERPPTSESDVLNNVALGFIRLAGALTAVQDREDTPFARAPVHHPSGRHATNRHVAAVAVILTLVAVMLWPRLLGVPPHDVDAIGLHPPSPPVWIDQERSPSVMGYPMPKSPFPGQLKPPCGTGGYVEVRGACWVQTKQDAPCSKDFAELEGKCYVPVREKKPEPRSIEP